jgi:phage shock protein PspC (stress-responsive transcriptional regulator)
MRKEQNMKEILRKLSSRKLWMAIAGVVTGIAMVLGADANEIATIAGAVTSVISVVTYIVTEGKIDAEGVKNAVEATQEAIGTIEGNEGA